MARSKLKIASVAEEAAAGRYVLDEQVGFLMRIAMQRHTSIFAANMAAGLTQTQFAALAKLHEVGPSSQNQLGRLIYLDAATIKGVVDRLSARGFVSALSDPKDRRRRAVTLTDTGRSITEQALKIAAKITAQTLAPLTASEQRTLAALLKKLG